MLRRVLLVVVGVGLVVAAVMWVLTAPKPLPASELAAGYHR